MERVKPVVLQCMSCRSILSDTLAYYVASDESARTVSVRDARVVFADSEEAVSTIGWDCGYSYRRLWCAFCRASLGRMYTSTAMRHDSIREMYTFNTEALVSYELGSLAAAKDNRTGNGFRSAPPKQIASFRSVPNQVASNAFHLGSRDGPSESMGHARSMAQPASNQNASPVDASVRPTSHSVGVDEEEFKEVKVAVSELDGHVCKLTTATNRLTVNQGKLDTALRTLSETVQSLQGEVRSSQDQQKSVQDALRNIVQDMTTLRANMQDSDTEIAKMENLFLIYEERFNEIQAVLRQTGGNGPFSKLDGASPALVSHVKPSDQHGTHTRNVITGSDDRSLSDEDVAVGDRSPGSANVRRQGSGQPSSRGRKRTRRS